LANVPDLPKDSFLYRAFDKNIGIKNFFPLEHVINRTPEFLRNDAHGEFCEPLLIQ